MDRLEQIEKEEEEKVELTLFKIDELEKSLEIIKVKCLEPIIDNSSNLEENRELFTFYLFIKESFKTLNLLQKIIKEKV